MKVLAIGDSFANVPFVFLPLVFETCNQLDMRHYSGSFIDYYNEFNPDIIIILVNPSELSSKNLIYDFFNDTPDASMPHDLLTEQYDLDISLEETIE